MAVARMKKVAVVSHASLKEEVTGRLQDLGVIQLTDVSEQEEDVLPLEVSEDRLDRVTRCLRYLGSFAARKKSLLETFVTFRESMTRDEFSKIISNYNEEETVDRCLADEARLGEINHERQKMEEVIELMTEWLNLRCSLQDLEDTASIAVIAGQISPQDGEAIIEASRDSLVHVEKVSEGNACNVVVWYLKADEAAMALVEEAGVNRVSFEGLQGTPAEVLDDAKGRCRELQDEETEIACRAQKLLSEMWSLRVLCDHLSFEADRARSSSLFAHTRQAFIMEGWVNARHMPALEESLGELGNGVAVVTQDPGPEDKPPVVLENHPLIKPFEVVTTLYGYPKYNEIDPTPLLAPFFFVFFGLALSDGGYGLGLMLLSLYFLRMRDFPEGGKNLFRLLFMGGISTVFFGALSASWFGNILETFTPLGGLHALAGRVAVFDPISNPLVVLGLALGMGIFQVWVGVFIKMLIDIREGRAIEGLLEQGSWLIVLAGVVYYILEGPVFGTELGLMPAMVGAILVMIAAGRRQKSILLKPFSAVMGLYGGIGYVGDVLSYARLLALGLATGVIAMVVNQMAVLPLDIPVLGVILMVIIMVGGHTFNLLLNTLGSFVHSGRLQFVEFFTKFFEGGGKAFRPFRKEGRFVNLDVAKATQGVKGTSSEWRGI